MNEEKLIDLSSVANGQLAEKLNEAIAKVLANMQDPNMPFKPSRVVKLALTFSQDESRGIVRMDFSIDTKMPPMARSSTILSVATDLRTNKVVVEEYGAPGGYPNQISFDQMKDVEQQESADDEMEAAAATKVVPFNRHQA